MKISNPTAALGEDLASDYLIKKGYKIIERNYRKSYTEVDIICVKDSILVFVEVKTRTSNLFGTPFEQISNRKLQHLIKTAEFYSKLNSQLPKQLRIDAIGIVLNVDNSIKKLKHEENISL